MKWTRVLPIALGAIVFVFGIAMPEVWYAPVLRPDLPVPSIRGIVLFRVALLIWGLALGAYGVFGFQFRRLTTSERPAVPQPPIDDIGLPRTRAMLVIVTLVALGLRSFQLGSDLWLDEIVTATRFASGPVLEIISTYGTSNNHLLNTLLVKASVVAFGEHEWSIRLPAMIFGTASVPVFFGLARQAVDTRKSIAASLLLAVSYHHVFFSQNARGYIGYVFFSMLATYAFVRALRSDELSTWLVYGCAMVLAFASLITSGYVFAAHVVVGLLAVISVRRRGGHMKPLVARLAVVFAVTGFLCFQVYALLLPQIVVFVGKQYSNPADAWRPFSAGFVREVGSGLAAGLNPPLLAVAVGGAALGLYGLLQLVRRNPAVTLSLLLPGVFQLVQLQLAGLSVTPRLFLLWLPLAFLVFVEGTATLAEGAARVLRRDLHFANRAWASVVLLTAGASLFSLVHYYTYPKQDYRGSLAYLDTAHRPDRIVLVAHLAETGYRYYGPRYGVRADQNYFYVRTVAALDTVLDSHPDSDIMVVTTLDRMLTMELPALHARIAREWVEDRRFPGTIGGGDVVVWKRRAAGHRG